MACLADKQQTTSRECLKIVNTTMTESCPNFGVNELGKDMVGLSTPGQGVPGEELNEPPHGTTPSSRQLEA